MVNGRKPQFRPAGRIARASRFARMMRSDLGRLAWLLEFAQRPLDPNLTKDEVTELQDQILAFCVCQAGPHFNSQDMAKLAALRLLNLQTQIRHGIRCFLGDPPQEWRLREVKQILIRDPKSGAGRLIPRGMPDLLFEHFAAELIAAEGARIEKCQRPQCGQLFVCRKRGAYCSKRCSQYVRTKRYREKQQINEVAKAELSEKRHRAYERCTKARTGQNVKVGRNRNREPISTLGGKSLS
jgi:hypothetical protein